ncbi:MAG: ATP-binding protein [Cyanobacteriota bacterium]|nr:ATP-binding protein [Cyanobacteriota bacterium]
MEIAILIGLQASGKSTFCREHFFETHIRINLDMLKTRHREQLLFQACLDAKQSIVVDNTNPTVKERARYILPACEKKFEIVGYYFPSDVSQCLKRNAKRSPDRIVPRVGIFATAKKLILPSEKEGFDRLYAVQIKSTSNSRDRLFEIQPWTQ